MPTIKLLCVTVSLLSLAACATTDRWSPAGGNRENGVVRVAYEYPEYKQPAVSDAQAETLALNRCNAWGYQHAQPIAGQIRQCASRDGNDCKLWTVTREFQCTDGDSGFSAARLSR